jgi:hypothetical protein
MAYDIVGDIHGQADKLHALLAHLGYRDTGGAFRHPSRTAIFVGDFIDGKEPRQVDSVTTVRRMVDAQSGLAIMGTHEFNAIAWHTPDPNRAGEYLRPHGGELGQDNRKQHMAFLAEVEDHPLLHADLIDWFLTLPLWLDLPSLRVVHACWHEGYMNELRPLLTSSHQLTRKLLAAASQAHRMEFRAVEGLTKGLETALPDGHSFQDKYGKKRNRVRIRWWDAAATTYRELAMLDDHLRERLPSTRVPDGERVAYDNAKPVFFGHYWMTGMPRQQSPTVACVDYSAAHGGPLVAYRWSGEPVLDANNFVSVG